MEFFRDDDVRLVVVPHKYDFHRDGNLFPQELVRALRETGHEVHFSTMLFHTDGLYASPAPTRWPTCSGASPRGLRSASNAC